MKTLHNPYAYRITPLLAHLITAQRDTSQSLAHLTDTMDTLNRNMDWVDGRITVLGAFQDRLVAPEQGLTQTIGQIGPNIVTTLAHQRSTLAAGIKP